MKYTTTVLTILGVVYLAALASRGLLAQPEPQVRGVDRAPIELQVNPSGRSEPRSTSPRP